MKKSVFITFSGVSVRQEEKIILSNINWKINYGEQWVIIGPNGAGKSTLAKTLLGKMPVSKGKLIFHFLKNNFQRKKLIDQIGYVSFDLHRWLIEAENQGIGHLSSGEAKKFLIDRALKKKPILLILDEPFEGLDQLSRLSFIESIDKLMKLGKQIILITHQVSNIPKSASHILLMKDGKIVNQGEKSKILNHKNINKLYSNVPIQNSVSRDVINHASINNYNDDLPEILIKMKNVSIRYGKKTILDNLNWQMKKGENWAIVGPNGIGKSTFLKLITGENTQAYANEITIFGRKKGTGETLWEIKKHIGEIFPETQLNYLKKINSFDVILSGFFDSVGLYYHPNKKQVAVGHHWVKLLDLEKLVKKKFYQLSTGQQRLILLTRAMIKSPPLLILDEPCQGLDFVNRKKILEVIDIIGKTNTNILYVSHYQNELPKCITNTLILKKEN